MSYYYRNTSMVRVAESNSEMTHGSIYKLDTSRGDVNDGCMVSPDSGKKKKKPRGGVDFER